MLVSSVIALTVLRKITIGINNVNDIEEAESKPVIDSEDNDDDSFSPENFMLLRRAGMHPSCIGTTFFNAEFLLY